MDDEHELLQQQHNYQNGGGGLYAKVMTDEQIEVLRRQISAFVTISQQLAEMHLHAVTSRQDHPLMSSSAVHNHKKTGDPKNKKRWRPSQPQLQILERVFDQGNAKPDKQQLREITSELSQLGNITLENVYYWFQNRRARAKRNQVVAQPPNPECKLDADWGFIAPENFADFPFPHES